MQYIVQFVKCVVRQNIKKDIYLRAKERTEPMKKPKMMLKKSIAMVIGVAMIVTSAVPAFAETSNQETKTPTNLAEAESFLKETSESLKKAEADKKSAEDALKEAEATAKTAKETLDVAKAEKESAAAKAEQAKSDLETAKNTLTEKRNALAKIDKNSESYKKAVKDAEDAKTLVSEKESALANAKAEYDTAKFAADTAQSVLTAAEKKAAERKTLKDAADEAKTAYETAKSTLDEKLSASENAEKEKDAAQNTLNNAKGELDSASKSLATATESADSAKTILDEKQKQHDDNIDAATKAVEDAQETYDNAGIDFLNSRVLEGYTFEEMFQKAQDSVVFTEIYAFSDAEIANIKENAVRLLSVENLNRAANLANDGNECRAKENVSALALDYNLMMFSALCNATSIKTRDHDLFADSQNVAGTGRGVSLGENLAWSSGNPYGIWYDTEKALKEAEEQKKAEDPTYTIKYSLFGHYRTLIAEKYTVCGISYDGHNAEQFFCSAPASTTCTPDEFIAQLNAFVEPLSKTLNDAKAEKNRIENELADATEKYNTAAKAKEAAEDAKTAAETAVTDAESTLSEKTEAAQTAKTAADSYRDNEYKTAQTAYNEAAKALNDFDTENPGVEQAAADAKTEYDSAKSKEDATKDKYDAAAKELTDAKTASETAAKALSDMEQKITDAEKAVSDAEQDVKAKETTASTAEQTAKEKSDAYEKAAADYADAQNAENDAKSALETATNTYTDALASYNLAKTYVDKYTVYDITDKANTVKVTGITDKTYKGKAITQNVKVTVNGIAATVSISYPDDRTSIGKHTVNITGTGKYTGTLSYTYNILPINIADKANTVKVTGIKDKTYTGKAITQSVKVTVNGVAATVKIGYPDGRTTVGKHTVTITGTGKYTGKLSYTYNILPKSTSGKKVSSYKKALKVSYKKVSNISGYQIGYRYSGSSKWYYANTTSTTKTISKLKSKKYYYVKVRTYKKVSGKNYYSSWTSTTKHKTK